MPLRAYIIYMLLVAGAAAAGASVTSEHAETESVAPRPKTFCVVLDPGHGGKDPGCVGKRMQEKTINLSVALKVGEMIEAIHEDVKVVYTRTTDVFIPLNERANIANRLKADLFISIHTNAARRSVASGTETFTIGLDNSAENLDVARRENSVIMMEDDYLQKYEGFDPQSAESYIIFEFMQNKHLEQSVRLASEIQKAFVRADRGDRGVKQAGLLVLRKTAMPAVLVELGFISNDAEERYMATEHGRTTLARAILKAFSNYKYDYERKLGAANAAATNNGGSEPKAADVPPRSQDYESAPREETPQQQKPSSRKQEKPLVYKIQILTADRLLPTGDRRFKGYSNVSHYKENGVYKYTYGETTEFQEILKLQRVVVKDFKDAFIIKMRDGKRVDN